MEQDDAIEGNGTQRGYLPRQFNPRARTRFLKDRREQHLSRVEGTPSDTQIAMVQSLATLEWAALQAEDDGTLRALREAREHRRLHLQILRDFEKTLGPVSAAKGRSIIDPPSASVTAEPVEHQAELPFPSTRRPRRYRDHAGGRVE